MYLYICGNVMEFRFVSVHWKPMAANCSQICMTHAMHDRTCMLHFELQKPCVATPPLPSSDTPAKSNYMHKLLQQSPEAVCNHYNRNRESAECISLIIWTAALYLQHTIEFHPQQTRVENTFYMQGARAQASF